MSDKSAISGEGICGEHYDHHLREIDSRDGVTSYECRNCGAEIIEEDEGGWE